MNEPVQIPREMAVVELPADAWHGPFPEAIRARARDVLEDGKVLFFPRLPFRPTDQEAPLLRTDAAGGARKSISFDPASGKASNVGLADGEAGLLTAMVDRFGRSAVQLLADLLPDYAPHLERARTSFRPAEIAGRTYSPRHDDRLLHVDAFPSRPMHGRRILRLFSNIAPDGAPRAWRVGRNFEEFAREFAPRVRRPAPGSAWMLRVAGLTRSRRSAYDHMMLRLHDLGKADADWQATSPRADISFPAGTTWACFTDQVLHAALAGHCALEQTFHVPVEAMAAPSKAPLRVLESVTQRTLI